MSRKVINNNAFSWPALLIFACLFGTSALAGGIVNPPIPHWIGPEANCDYPTIQAALDDIFDCGIIFPCPQGRNELRLSANYNHAGQVIVSRTFDIRGGYATCKAPFNPGVQANLSAVQGGVPLFVIRPGNSPVDNVFRNLRLFGNIAPTARGGVINMESGYATLTLRDSLVNSGRATLLGGGIALAGNGNRLVIDNTRVLNNYALQGGGISCNSGGVIDFHSGFIEENTAELSGGGIYMQAQCQLLGNVRNRNRQILRNKVADIQFGEGAGIHALASTIDLGALFSRTIIEGNEVEWALPLHDYDQPGNNRGGGVHLANSNATFLNTWFRGNTAADGGAISAVGTSNVLVDRSSGPCHATDIGNSSDCSLFEYNRARGGKDTGGEEGGDGAVVYLAEAFGNSPNVSINRSTWRFNKASCYEDDAPVFAGECDLEDFGASDSSIARGIVNSVQSLSLVGNLIYGNDIGDDDGCNGAIDCLKLGVHVRYANLFGDNTTFGNSDADLFASGSNDQLSAVNNIIWDLGPDEFYRGNGTDVVSCNISNFASEMNQKANSIPISNANLDPQFIDPADEDFRVTVPSSPAIDRCDDADGLASLGYDIVGTPRPLAIAGSSHGPGLRDVGAFEAKPAGYVNNGIDLVALIESESPKTADVLEAHLFTINVRNSGRNGTDDIRLSFTFGQSGTITALSSGRDLNGNLGWDCSAEGRHCTSLLNLGPGGTTPPIYLRLSFDTPGLKMVAASAPLQDNTLIEVEPANNIQIDTVTILQTDVIFAEGFDG